MENFCGKYVIYAEKMQNVRGKCIVSVDLNCTKQFIYDQDFDLCAWWLHDLICVISQRIRCSDVSANMFRKWLFRKTINNQSIITSTVFSKIMIFQIPDVTTTERTTAILFAERDAKSLLQRAIAIYNTVYVTVLCYRN